MSMAACTNYAGLLAARIFLGTPESAVVLACIMYFATWYKPSERAFRIGVFHSANALASAVSAFITAGVGHLNGRDGLDSQPWVFTIEDVLPIAMAPVMFLLLLTFPEASTALSERERYIAINRFDRGSARKTNVSWGLPAFRRIFKRPATYIFLISYVSLCMVAVTQGTCLPTILKP